MSAASEAHAAPAAPAVSPPPGGASSTTPAAAPTTTIVPATEAQPGTKRRLTEKIFGAKIANDIEKQKPHPDDDEETRRKKKKRYAAASCGLLSTILGAILFTLLVAAGLSILAAYAGPILSCKLHGYENHCMFNDWSRNGEDIMDKFNRHLPWNHDKHFPVGDW